MLFLPQQQPHPMKYISSLLLEHNAPLGDFNGRQEPPFQISRHNDIKRALVLYFGQGRGID